MARLPLIACAVLAACAARAQDAAPILDPPGVLRACADPNNLPFSDADGTGLENVLAQHVARDLGLRLETTWLPQRRGFIRNTLKAGTCVVVFGIPSSLDLVEATRPYYRSTYVFVTRRDAGPPIESLDDPRLKTLRIGVPIVGDDYADVPPAHALIVRGLGAQLRGYSVYGDYSKPHPPSAVVDAVVARDVDVAVAWGPLAGYFARRSPVPLVLWPVTPQVEVPFVMQVFDVSMGVRHGDHALRDRLDAWIASHQDEIRAMLKDYGVPVVEGP